MRSQTGASVEALESIYRSHFDQFLRFATAITGDPGRGADAVHEAFVRALNSRLSYRGEANLEAWTWRIVVNTARSQREKHAIWPLVDEDVGNVGSDENSSHASDLRRVIASLPERQRLAIFLRYFADLDYKSIGSVLGIETGTVSAALNAAHRRLRVLLEEVTP